MKWSTALAAEVFLGFSLAICQALRRGDVQPGPNRFVQSYSKSVSMATGEDGQLHSFTRETETSRTGAGASAHVESIVRECRDGICEERVVEDPNSPEHLPTGGSHWIPRPFGDLGVMLPEPPSVFDMFGDVGPFSGFRGYGWGAPHAELPRPLDSVTRTVEISEDDEGERQHTEAVTRCHKGECTTEHRRVDEDGDHRKERIEVPEEATRDDRKLRLEVPEEASARHRSGAPAAMGRAAAQGIEDMLDRPAAASASSSAAYEEELWGDAARQYGQGGLQVTPAVRGGVTMAGGASAKESTGESVTRTITIKESNGKIERTEIVERCKDGECTREVHRSSEDSEDHAAAGA